MQVTNSQRAAFGFALGLILMFAATRVFLVNPYDFENMQRGVRLLLSGVNPWADVTRVYDFYNPPHAVLFLWPMLFLSPQIFLVIGAACLFAFVFYHRAWVALAWFATNTMLWLISAGGIDMFVIGVGLLFLMAGDTMYLSKRGLVFRVIAYGILMVKPQGGMFIVLLYLLTRMDWKGFALSLVFYGVLFIPLYPSWLDVVLYDPPTAQAVATHTILGKYGLSVALLVALGAVIARKWHYWQLGGALACILTPYGMPGVPIFLILTGVTSMKAIPIVVIWSALLAVVTWVTPPAGVDYYGYLAPFMAIYHLSMFGLALTLACVSPDAEGQNLISVSAWLRRMLAGRIF
ncbi:MAG: hypothetical protein JW908_15605 [Anaerolineales bacterium]|nr:hypothetical protein [Anaerolineales bacterium]